MEMKNSMRYLIAPALFVCLSATTANAAELGNSVFVKPEGAIAIYVDDVDDIIGKAFAFYQEKKYDEALAECLKAAALSPRDPRPHSISGLVYLSQFKLKEAIAEFDKSIALNPANKNVYVMKARAHRFSNESELALAACKAALEIDPKFADAHYLIGDILRFNKERRSEAIAAFKAAISESPAGPAAYVMLAQMIAGDKDNKDEKSAEEMFQKAMSLDPKKMAGRFEYGRYLVGKGRLKEAREIWNGRASDTDDTFPNFITMLKTAEEVKEATDALAAKPNDPATLVRMGEAVMEGPSWVVDERQKHALVHFKKALEIDPKFADAQYAICKAYVQMAEFDESKTVNVDRELAKLRIMDPKLAKEMEKYRKNYQGGLRTGDPGPPPMMAPPRAAKPKN